jgi:hypothetical protein
VDVREDDAAGDRALLAQEGFEARYLVGVDTRIDKASLGLAREDAVVGVKEPALGDPEAGRQLLVGEGHQADLRFTISDLRLEHI